ncbi:MAG TPA: toll/interleukin-1 receptor domain-containing protein, partial [Isosphaeraceae bacterium]
MDRPSHALPADLFLSHATPDRAFADRLVAVLRGHGVPVWYSQTNLLGAQQWHDEIGRALDRCDWFAVVMSPAALKSKWVERELHYALNEDRYIKKITP